MNQNQTGIDRKLDKIGARMELLSPGWNALPVGVDLQRKAVVLGR